MKVRPCDPDHLDDCDVLFSALDAVTGREVEGRFAERGFAVISNCSAYRQAPDVPILVPEVNAGHVDLVDAQRARTGGGFIVTNPNCSAAGLVVALAPLHRSWGIRRVVVTTLQALSGAGADGPRAVEMIDNVLPFIGGEEDKIERETRKMLGDVREGSVEPASFDISAHCHRVSTRDGHLEAVSVELADAVEPERAGEVLHEFRGEVADLDLPSSPERLIEVRAEPDRPQPRLDRDAGDGMTVVVGRLRACPTLTLRLVVLSHNLVRGAAGGAVLNAELLAARDMLPRRTGA
jgi:aspartate-semialdehyde dehydrogenase